MIWQKMAADCPGWPANSFPVINWSPIDAISGGQYYKVCLELEEVPQNIPVGTTNLYLNGNLIKNITAGSLGHLTSCTEIRLDFNKINSVDFTAFTGLTSLQKLYLYDNSLTSLPSGVFSGLTALQELWLNTNEITILPDDIFHNLLSLHTMVLHTNNLAYLPDEMFAGLTSLQVLSISRNQISMLQADIFRDLLSLQQLYFSDNRLITLSSDVLNSSIYLDQTSPPTGLQLSLSGNPFQCDSCMCWLKKGEQDGWLTWFTSSGTVHGPDCSESNITWPDINCTLPCTDTSKNLKYISKYIS